MPNHSNSSSPQSGQSSSTTRSTAFMIEHLIGKKQSSQSISKNILNHQSRDKLRRGISADDDDEDKMYDNHHTGSQSPSGSSGSGRSQNESPRIHTNSGHLSKAGAIAASVRHHVMNSYMPLELTKPGSRGHRESPGSPASTVQATYSSRHSPTPNSASTSPVDLAGAAANYYHQQQQAAAALHGGSQHHQQYYPFGIPMPGFQSASGSGNFGFHAGLIPPHWGNPFLTLPLHRGMASFGYGPPRQYNPLTSLVSKRKGGQIRFTNNQTSALEKAFRRHKYLSANERKKLAAALRLTDRQVKTWFQNRRAKWRKSKEVINFENETQVSRSSFGAPDSPDDGRCQSVTEVKIEKIDQHPHNNPREHITPNQSNSGGKIYVPTSSDHSSEKLYRGLTHRSLGHNKLISCT